MNGFLTVARRELRERRNLLLAAPILALVPLLAPYLPGLTRVPEAEVRLAFTTGLGFALPFALALGLGASALGDEIAGRRLGFFFARPLRAFEIWSGKVVVALVVPVAVAALILGPLVLARQEGSEMPWRGFSSFPTFALVGLSWMLASLAHVAAGLYRTRSPWLVLDLAFAGALGGALYLLGWHVVDSGIYPLAPQTLGPDLAPVWIPTLFLVGVCLAAGFAQVAVGGSDPRLGHRALSLTLWGGLGLGLAATAARSAWILNPALEDLGYRSVVPLPGGHSFLLGGVRPGGAQVPATFLVDLRDGSARRVTGNASAAVPSAGGRHVLFGEGLLSPRLVVVSAVADQAPVITRAALAQEAEAWPVCLSDDGLLAVLRAGGEARVVDTATGKRSGLPALEAADSCTFEGRRGLLLYRTDLTRRTAYRRRVDLETGAQGERVEYPGAEGILAARGDRVLVRRRGQSEVGLVEASTGRLLMSHGVAFNYGDGEPVTFLPDGQVAFMSHSGENTLLTFDSDGRERLAVPVADRGKGALAGVTPAGEICVVVRSKESLYTLVLDPQTGAVRQRIEGLRPARGPLAFLSFDPSVRLAQSQERLRQGLFQDAQGALVRFDRATGSTKALVAAGPRSDEAP